MSAAVSKTIIGVMGPRIADKVTLDSAYMLGELIANEGYILLTGGGNSGVMHEALRGAKSANGLTIGVLIDNHSNNMSQYVDVPIVTGMGSARNNINVLSSTMVVACGIGSGTASEVALALKADKDVILLNNTKESYKFFKSLSPNKVWLANEAIDVIKIIKNLL